MIRWEVIKYHTKVDARRGCTYTAGGYGLMGLRERVQLVDGTVTAHTAPSQGLRLWVPNVLGKLGIGDRTQAALRAKELGLLLRITLE